jgi:hypothetical protein
LDFAHARLVLQHVDKFDQPPVLLVQMVVTDAEFRSPDEIAHALLPCRRRLTIPLSSHQTRCGANSCAAGEFSS